MCACLRSLRPTKSNEPEFTSPPDSYVKHRPRLSDSYAMDWAFDHQTCFYRSGYDLSLPLKPKVLFPQFASVPSTNRKFFLTFKVRHDTTRHSMLVDLASDTMS